MRFSSGILLVWSVCLSHVSLSIQAKIWPKDGFKSVEDVKDSRKHTRSQLHVFSLQDADNDASLKQHTLYMARFQHSALAAIQHVRKEKRQRLLRERFGEHKIKGMSVDNTSAVPLKSRKDKNTSSATSAATKEKEKGSNSKKKKDKEEKISKQEEKRKKQQEKDKKRQERKKKRAAQKKQRRKRVRQNQ